MALSLGIGADEKQDGGSDVSKTRKIKKAARAVLGRKPRSGRKRP